MEGWREAAAAAAFPRIPPAASSSPPAAHGAALPPGFLYANCAARPLPAPSAPKGSGRAGGRAAGAGCGTRAPYAKSAEATPPRAAAQRTELAQGAPAAEARAGGGG